MVSVFEKFVTKSILATSLNSVFPKGIDTTGSCTLRNHLGGKEIVEVFSVVITAAFFQVAIHKKEDLWTTSSFWKHCADSLKNLGLQNEKGKKALLAYVLRYILSPDGSFLMFGDDNEYQNKSLQVRMKTQYERRGHDPIFIIVSDVPENTLLLTQILRRCSIEVIELKAKDFSSDANVSQLSAVSAAILNAAKNSNDDVNQMSGVDLVQVGIALVLEKDLEQTEPPKKKSNYIRTLTTKGQNLIKNFEITDEEGNVDIKGIRGTVVKKKKSQGANVIYNIKFEDGHEETMDDEEVIGKEEFASF